MELSKSSLVAAADAAYLARSNMTSNHPLTAPGSVSYFEGVGAMRDALIGKGGWTKSTVNGSEYVENRGQGLRIEFCNVEIASSVIQDPEPISPRKTNSRSACHANGQQYDMWGEDPSVLESSRWTTYFLMVGVDGTAELSLPLNCASGKFKELVERIFLITREDLDEGVVNLEPDVPEDDIDFEIVRRG